MTSGVTAHRQRGLALIVVLWAAIILALIAGGVTRVARDDLNLARNLAEAAQAEMAADSALWLALHTLGAGEEEAWRADGSVYGWRFAGARVRVSVSDEMGRIDLNAASPELLAALFHAAGEDAEASATLADEIVRFREVREADAEARAAAGFDPDEPLGAEAGVRVFNRVPVPLRLIDEVATLPGMTPWLWRRVAPALTVYTGVARPVHDASPALVRAALDGEILDEDDDGEQGLGGADDLDVTDDAPSIVGEPVAPTGQVSGLMHVQAEALSAGGAHFSRDAVVAVYDRRGLSYRVRLWRRGNRVLFPVPGARGIDD